MRPLLLLVGGSLSAAVLFGLSGCVSPLDETSKAVMNAERGDKPAEEKSADRPAEKAAPAEAARREERDTATRRDERPAPGTAREGRPGADAGRAELVAQLNEATRELATLRATNARLKAERGSSPSSASSSASPADEKLGALRSYTQFKQEIASVLADLEKLRSDNAALTAQVKELRTKSDQNAAATVARLEKELQAEKAARAEAERTAASLRDQLRAVARAVNASGVAPEKSGGR